MKKLIAVISIIVILTGCATLGPSASDSDYTQKQHQVISKSVEQNIWDIVKIGVGGLINAILFNNYLIHP